MEKINKISFDDRSAPFPKGIWFRSTISSKEHPSTWEYSANRNYIIQRPEQFVIYE